MNRKNPVTYSKATSAVGSDAVPSTSTSPISDPSGDPALFSSLMDALGRSINEYAFGDIPALAATLDRVTAWDDSHPDDYAPQDTSRENVKAGLKAMRAQIVEQQDRIRKQRAANGLPNRRDSNSGS